MKIGIIVEGSTDSLLLKEIINKLCPGEHEYKVLQPVDMGESFGEMGTGWKGVRRFCIDAIGKSWGGVFEFIDSFEFDLLIIQIDADVASETDLQEGIERPVADVLQSCPPIGPTIEKLKRVVAKWWSVDEVASLPSQLIFAIPAQDSENWLFAALFPDDELCQQATYECIHPQGRQHPGYLLTLREYGRILRRSSGKIKKSRVRYERVLPDVNRGWERACQICTQAQIFNDSILGILP